MPPQKACQVSCIWRPRVASPGKGNIQSSDRGPDGVAPAGGLGRSSTKLSGDGLLSSLSPPLKAVIDQSA